MLLVWNLAPSLSPGSADEYNVSSRTASFKHEPLWPGSPRLFVGQLAPWDEAPSLVLFLPSRSILLEVGVGRQVLQVSVLVDC